MFKSFRSLLARWVAPMDQKSLQAQSVSIEQIGVLGDKTVPASVAVPSPHAIAYDDYLYDRSRTQWQFGDWESLAKLDHNTIQNHPERAKLALLSATAHLQLDNIGAAKQMIKVAQNWGCSKKLVAQILISGVHNSLGRAALVAGNQIRGTSHFETAILTGTPGSEVRLMSHARAAHQADNLKIPTRMMAQSLLRGRKPKESIAIKAKSSQPGAPAKIGTDIQHVPQIAIAGMRHSGSTALYNIVRLALGHARIDFSCGYAEYTSDLNAVADQRKIRLIKIHEFRDDVAYGGGLFITTRRDIRDTVASAVRRNFPMLEKANGPAGYARYNRILHDVWLPFSDYVFVYEDFMKDPMGIIENLLAFMGLPDVSAESIFEEVKNLPTDQYQLTLLSPSHITDPDHNLTFQDTLDSSVIEKINHDHAVWLSRYGYV
jgi:hypothetical protein